MQTGCSHPSSSPASHRSLPFRSGFKVEETFPGSWLGPPIWNKGLVGRRHPGASAGCCPVASAPQVGTAGLESWHLWAWGWSALNTGLRSCDKMGQPSGQRIGHDFALSLEPKLWLSAREHVLWSSMKYPVCSSRLIVSYTLLVKGSPL